MMRHVGVHDENEVPCCVFHPVYVRRACSKEKQGVKAARPSMLELGGGGSCPQGG